MTVTEVFPVPLNLRHRAPARCAGRSADALRGRAIATARRAHRSILCPAPVPLQDLVELLPQRLPACYGRNTDLLEIAGKRASLGLTRRLLALPGVQDGVVFQLDADRAGVRRLAALVVAPQRSEAGLLAALRLAIDPAFLPRPLRRVAALTQ